MKTLSLTLATLCVAFASLAAHADAASGPVTCKDGTTSEKAGRGACSGHGGINKDAATPATAPAAAPVATTTAAAPTLCKDGTTSEKAGRGACSGHGGVNKGDSTTAAAAPATAAAKASAPATTKPAAPPAAASTAAAATGATLCKDGTTSEASGRGACSGHGGVNKGEATATAAPASAAKSAPAPAAAAAAPPVAAAATKATAAAATPVAAPPAAPTSTTAKSTGGSGAGVSADPTGAIAKCKDGMYSHASSHSGACSRHGGVAEFLDAKP